jgi:membrane protease YdiL (CAAX protease family)
VPRSRAARAHDVKLADFRAYRSAVESWQFFEDAWHDVDDARSTSSVAARDYDPIVAMVVAALSLTLMEYWGGIVALRQILVWCDRGVAPEHGLEAYLKAIGYWDLTKLAYWCAARVLGYAVIPAIVLRVRGQRLADQNLATKGIGKHAFIYLTFYLVALKAIIEVSATPEFATYYPFYDLANRSWSDLLAWEAMYAAHFFAIEFFFRGYLLESCRKSFGTRAIFISAVPYVMVHFGKPMLETLAALLAGIGLGALAMTTRSIWLGFGLHVAVAITMDLASLLRTRGLPTEWLPPY